MKRTALALVSLLALAGCGTAPSAAIVQPSLVTDAQAMSATKATVAAKDGHLRLTFDYARLMKEPETFSDVCVQTKIGGIFSSVWLAQDSQLYVKTDNPLNSHEAPTWYAVGTFDIKAAKQGQAMPFKLIGGARLTYSKAHHNFPFGETPALLNLDLGGLKPMEAAPTLLDAK
jgi:hypothetical protein